MTLQRGWKARQDLAQKRLHDAEKMHEINRQRAAVIGVQYAEQPIIAPTAPNVSNREEIASAYTPEIDEDQFDPSVDVAPEPARKTIRKK